jgi:hypothetical protein
MKRFFAPKSDPRRRGVTVVFVTISLFTLFACASLAIDVGYICALTAEAQNTADAGALAGANLLQEKIHDTLEKRVLRLIGLNQKPQGYFSLDDQIIEVGKWDSYEQKFYPLDRVDWEDAAFAVRVRAARNEVGLFFAPIAGHKTTDVTREAVAIGSRPCRGIWGLEGVRVPGGVVTDSYESGDGAYDPLTAGSNGDLCSGREIEVMGSVEVNGDAMAGFGYPVTVKGQPIITGLTTSNVSTPVVPDMWDADIEFSNDNLTIGLTDSGKSPWKFGVQLDVQGVDTIGVAPGKYLFEAIKLGGGAKVTVTGPTTFYVKGSIDALGGTIVNTTQNPNNLTIISMGSDVKLSGGTGFYGTVFAPEADISLSGTADFYGAVVGKTTTIQGDFTFHVDESLPVLDLFTPPAPFLVK